MGNRVPLLAMLIAIEVAIVGVAIYTFTDIGKGTIFAGGAGMHPMKYVQSTFAPFAAGDTPKIAVDDPLDRVYVTVSADNDVHVFDQHTESGMVWGGSHTAPLKVERTSDGIAVSRASGHDDYFGDVNTTDRIAIQVPAGATLAFTDCSGAEITGVQGGVTAHSSDGSIFLTDVRGTVNVTDDDGRIEATRVSGDSFTARSSDGRIVLDNVNAPKIDARTSAGKIVATFAPDTNAVVSAHTDSGHIMRDGSKVRSGSDDDDSDVSATSFTLGSGGGNVSLETDDGVITIFTNGAHQ